MKTVYKYTISVQEHSRSMIYTVLCDSRSRALQRAILAYPNATSIHVMED